MATKQKNAKDSENAKRLIPSPSRHTGGTGNGEYLAAKKVSVPAHYSNSKWDVGMMGGVMAHLLGYPCPITEQVVG